MSPLEKTFRLAIGQALKDVSKAIEAYEQHKSELLPVQSPSRSLNSSMETLCTMESWLFDMAQNKDFWVPSNLVC